MPVSHSVLSSLLALSIASSLAAADFPARPPADVTRVMDRDQMMSQLGITFPEMPSRLEDPNKPANAWPTDPENPDANWTDAKSNTITRGGFGLWVTYDDNNPGDYTPINLLKMNDGTPVRTAADWWNKRRPEVYHDVQEQLYGFLPPADQMPGVTWSSKSTIGGNLHSPWIEQEITGTIDISSYPQVRDAPKILGRLRVPANATGPVPIIIVFGGRGFDNTYDQFIAPQGWGLVSFDLNALQPDNGQYLTSYLIGLVNKGAWRKPDDMGQLVAGAWGIGQLIDYLETVENVDATKIGLQGHSRWGKATIVAQAFEPRITISYPSCGGALGPSMIRRHWGQNLENLAWDREYHWVNGNAFKYMGPVRAGSYMPRKVENLTVDAHSLVALVAPRPVFLNGGTTDTWSDAPGTFLTGIAASPVYELLGKKGLVAPTTGPEVDVAYLEGDIGYRVHDGGHTPLPDWPAFIEFSKKYFD